MLKSLKALQFRVVGKFLVSMFKAEKLEISLMGFKKSPENIEKP